MGQSVLLRHVSLILRLVTIWLLIVEIALLTDMVKQTVIYVKCCADWFVRLGVFSFIAFV